MKRFVVAALLLLVIPLAQAKGPSESTWLRPDEPMRLLVDVAGNASFQFHADEPVRVFVDASGEPAFNVTQPFGEVRLPVGRVTIRVSHENATEVLLAWVLEGFVTVLDSDGVHHLPQRAFRTPGLEIACTWLALVAVLWRIAR